jgi:DNA (cytosine-5)-methyltransferase 1
MDCLHLFNGIGGFALAAAMMGWRNVAHCEINEFCNRVMANHFPESIKYGDIDQSDFTFWRGRIDVVTGGFPCQPFSGAGSQLGMADPRYKWPSMYRAIREIQPPWVVAENVPSFVTWGKGVAFETLHTDLEAAGYETTSFIIPAASVGAPHRRERLWIVAYSDGFRRERSAKKQHVEAGGNARGNSIGTYEIEADTNPGGSRQLQPWWPVESIHSAPGADREISGALDAGGWVTEPPLCGTDDGVSDGVDELTALGNAVVPQVVVELFSVIDQFQKFTST